MDELEFRRRLYAQPSEVSDELHEFANNDAERQQFLNDIQQLDAQLHDALNIEVPDNLADKILLNQRLNEHKQYKRRGRVHLAIAASVAFAFGIIFNLYNPAAPLNLEQHALDHVYHELASLTNTDQQFPIEQVNAKLASFGGQLTNVPGDVSYLTFCNFKSQKSLHMVLNTQSGPVTLFIIPANNQRESSSQFADQRFNGSIYQSASATIIMLGENNTQLQPLQNQIKDNLIWQI